MIRAYLRELLAEAVLKVFFAVDFIGVAALVWGPWAGIQNKIPPTAWAITLGVLGYVLANYQVYRKYALGFPVGNARAMLDQGDPQLRAAGVDELAGFDSRLAQRVLREALGHDYTDVRYRAALRLAETGDRRALPVLRALLRSGKAPYLDRGHAADQLGRLHDKKAIDDLASVATAPRPIEDSIDFLRSRAVDALGHLGDAAVATLSGMTVDDALRYKALEALGEVGTPAAAAALGNALDAAGPYQPAGADNPRRVEVLDRLVWMDDPAVVASGDPALAELLGAERYRSYDVTKRLSQVAGLPGRLERFLNHPKLASPAVYVLGYHPDGAALLVKTLRTNPTLRVQAAQALYKVPAGGAKQIATILQEDADEEVIRAALVAITYEPSTGDVEALCDGLHRWLHHGSVQLRAAAAEALQYLGDAGKAELVKAAGSDQVPAEVRRAAVLTVTAMMASLPILRVDRTSAEVVKTRADAVVGALLALSDAAEEFRQPARKALRLLADEGVIQAQDAIDKLPPEMA